MARKQTRRSVSINRGAYEAAKQVAAQRGMSLSALVEAGLSALGVPVVAHPQQTPELVQRSIVRRAENRAVVAAAGVPVPVPVPAPVAAPVAPARRRSREREVLGDQVADAYGFA
jgi:hypothetical protein